MEFFEENLAAFPVILPLPYTDAPDQFRHVRLHNGTVWRWTRPLIGLDTPTPHLRIEHRVMPAGPDPDRHDRQYGVLLRHADGGSGKWRGSGGEDFV